MQHDLRLVQLPLHLHNTVRLVRILVFHHILLQLRVRYPCHRRRRERRPGVRGEELVDDLGEELVRDERGVLRVGDDEAADPLRGAVGVEGVGLFFDVLAHAGARAFGDGLGEDRHEFAVAVRIRRDWC